MSDLTFEEYVQHVSHTRRAHPAWRAGQAYFNVLYSLRPDLSEQVRGSAELDPFHVDARLPAFLAFVMEEW